ncbi:E3 ubiquitin-protein ligase RNF220-like [Physella acuta]|uniref:E3 ubiquitin-protein ligase RNF220-like n=1 Tax=Physella acuta TaxID=109671 RepID=UPI0027DBED10|nr:E3 ubiquitin-protein ligase RNF220-like [Physella acuta]
MMSTDLQRSLAMYRFNFWPKPFFAPAPGSGGMDNPSFMPNPLSSPTLMVLASTAEGNEAPRLPGPPHPFSGQGMDKDLPPPPPFSTAGFTMYRPGDPFSAPLFSHLSFVRPGIDRRLAMMNHNPGVRPGVFRPLGPEGVEGSYHSAFSPAKKIKSDESSGACSSSEPQGSHSGDGGFRDDHSQEERDTPPGVKEERPSSISSAGYDTISEPESCDAYERGTPDSEGRALRKQRKRVVLDGHTPCCPVCGLTLRSGELEAHLMLEIDKLDKIARTGRKSSRDSTPQGRKSLPSPSGSRKNRESPPPDVASRSRYDNFLRIRCNRQSRLSARSRNKKKRPGDENVKETVCPVCNDRVLGVAEDLNAHVELCLKQRDGEEEPVDVEGEYEEYEWAGQTRVRATSMLEGGFSGQGFQTVNSKRGSDEDGELNVDGDDTEEYGKPQFSEKDILPLGSMGSSPHNDNKPPRSHLAIESSFSSRTDTVNSDGGGCSKSSVPYEGFALSNCDQGEEQSALIAALRMKLRDLEAEKSSKQKCLICMESYKTPLTSIQCWHVHCEACWMRTLGAKKLCPQCNMITAPTDLRRVYL